MSKKRQYWENLKKEKEAKRLKKIELKKYKKDEFY
ncbi:hypothetical protein EDC18_1054 [Natranaerovirga pectinivora]|uniref:Uncharacterized protein n=1 Tax=Natranaerovirga pectinivora TaxID=682400 RepID=A0A4V2V077_9FIRM|nr:hypothetical protein EDC18_1054 [Natranaerovirga pectinivora]